MHTGRDVSITSATGILGLSSPRLAEECSSLTGREAKSSGREPSSSYFDGSSDEDSTVEPGSPARRCALRLCVALLVFVLALVLLHACGFTNYLVRQGVISGMAYLFGYDADLDSADVSLTTGRTRLVGLSVDNPPDFTGHFLEIREVVVDARFGTIFSNPVWVNNLDIEGVVLTVEQVGASSNVQIIVESFQNITYFPLWLESTTLVIEHISISDITLRCMNFVNTTLPVSKLVIDDIGKPDGVSVKEVAAEAVKRLISHAMAQIPDHMRQAFREGVSDVRDGLADAAHALERPFVRAVHTVASAMD